MGTGSRGRRFWYWVGQLLRLVAGVVLIVLSAAFLIGALSDPVTRVMDGEADISDLAAVPVGLLGALPGALGVDLLRNAWRSLPGRRAPVNPPPGADGSMSLPSPWDRPRARGESSAFGVVLALWLVLMPGLSGVGGLLLGESTGELLAGLFFLALGFSGAVLFLAPGFDRKASPVRLPRLELTGESAVLFGPAHWRRLLLLGPLGLVVFGGAGILISGAETLNVLFVPILCIGLGLMLWYVVRSLRRRKGFALTPSGVLVLGNRWRSAAASWDRVRDVTAYKVRTRGLPHLMIDVEVADVPDPWAASTGLPMATGRGRAKSRFDRPFQETRSKRIIIEASALRCDPAVLYHTLRFYLHHPEVRGELGSPAALDRITHRTLITSRTADPLGLRRHAEETAGRPLRQHRTASW